MTLNPLDDELLRSYLLGRLPEEEADGLEARLLQDDELFLLAEAVEADLLAAADRGELAPEERERVLRRLASSPQGRSRLALAHALNQEAGPAQAEKRQAVVVPFRPRVAAMRWAALAAAVVAAAGLSWYSLSNQNGGGSAPQVVQERPAPAHPVEPRTTPPQPAPTVEAELSRVAFNLTLLSLRGEETLETLTVPEGTGLVELRLSGDDLGSYKTFDVRIRNRAGETVWEQDGLRAKAGPVVVAEVPAGRLPDGTYEIQTEGRAAGGEPEELAPLEVEIDWKR
jgi:hypothetical protein